MMLRCSLIHIHSAHACVNKTNREFAICWFCCVTPQYLNVSFKKLYLRSSKSPFYANYKLCSNLSKANYFIATLVCFYYLINERLLNDRYSTVHTVMTYSCIFVITKVKLNLQIKSCCNAHLSNTVGHFFCGQHSVWNISFDLFLLYIEQLFSYNTYLRQLKNLALRTSI